MEISRGREFDEQNILAIVDASGAKHTNDANDDRIAFLEAVRAVSILSEDGFPPTEKMNEEVLKILKVGKTLQLIMASYQLLTELDKKFPRVYFTGVHELQADTNDIPELIIVKEAWSPFVPTLDFSECQKEADKVRAGLADSSGFHLLVQQMIDLADETSFQNSDIESVRRLLQFQYMVSVLENDFVPRNSAYNGTLEWNLLRESSLNMLLGSRKLNYKSFVKDCISLMCRLYEISAAFSDESAETNDTSMTIALLEAVKNASISMQRLFTIIMELDESRKKADMEGHTTRADGLRTGLMELILDELTYNSDIIQTFLHVYCEPKWKLELIVQFLLKYIAKPSVRTRRSNTQVDELTFEGLLKRLVNDSCMKNTVKKIGAEILQLLTVHGFQACLSLLSKDSESVEGTSASLMELCNDFISAFRTLKQSNKNTVILSSAKEALFAAAAIVSVKA